MVIACVSNEERLGLANLGSRQCGVYQGFVGLDRRCSGLLHGRREMKPPIWAGGGAGRPEFRTLADQPPDVDRHLRGKTARGPAATGLNKPIKAVDEKALGPLTHNSPLDPDPLCHLGL